ncbi:SUKH-3 domain-containing protein [Micromonospora lupini]|uniref:hypothetical protein n=1 Tax=Micromonospora lupini TaxID=285679 RepID=UPI00224F0063|nr:hypothetical protein [Micromonospora lupini]MCX5066867.1 SUKH-3 domain-containing protein [Micromonospora lupini]
MTEWPYPPTPWEERYAYPTAENVRELARYAMSVGWTPEAVGGTFRIVSGADVALPGLAVTDLLSTADLSGPTAGQLYPVGEEHDGPASVAIDADGTINLLFDDRVKRIGPGLTGPGRLLEGEDAPAGH